MASAGIAHAVSHSESIGCGRVHDNGQSVPARPGRNLDSPTMRTTPDEAQTCVVRTAETPEHRIAESIFAEVRPWLFGIAYRTVGDVAEAEDIIQEAWIRWQNCDRSAVRDARAFLAATTARLASNAVQS